MGRRETDPTNDIQKKESLDIRALLRTVFWFLLTVGSYIVRCWFIDHRKNDKNTASFLAGIIVVSVFFLLKSLYRLLPKRFKDNIKEKLGKAVNKLISKISNMSVKLKKGKKGSKADLSGRIRFSEELKFVFDSEKGKRSAFSREPAPKWKNLKNNPEKVRFLFPRFVAKSGKKGYRYSITSTPYENGVLWKLSESDGNDMFRIYTAARYSGGRVETTDAEVEYSKKCADLNGK